MFGSAIQYVYPDIEHITLQMQTPVRTDEVGETSRTDKMAARLRSIVPTKLEVSNHL